MRSPPLSEIEIGRVDVVGELSHFQVRIIDDDGSATEHAVTLSRSDHERLGAGYTSAEAFIHACFGSLLTREPKESILRSFDVSQIATYFPEFPREIATTPR